MLFLWKVTRVTRELRNSTYIERDLFITEILFVF